MLRKLMKAVVGFAVIATVAIVPQSPAFAGTQGPTTIVGRQSGKCIDVPYETDQNGVIMQIYSCDAAENQLWFFTDTSGGYYNIENWYGRCLTVKGASTANNADIIQYTCNTGDNEEWKTVYLNTAGGRDYYKIVNRKSQKCLTVKGASTANTTALLQYTCNGGTNQAWTWAF